MTTRKPKLDLLYVPDSSMPWLQLAVVTTESNPSHEHARRWQSVRFAGRMSPMPAAPTSRKH